MSLPWETELTALYGEIRAPIEQIAEGQVLTTALGSCFVAQRGFDLSNWHGRLPVGSLLFQADQWALRARREVGFARLDLRQALFLDTETTGLGVGARTLVFLVGLGYFQDKFCLQQYVMRSPAEEMAMLSAVASRLTGCSTLVTFNGRAFDWPQLMSRFAYAGLERPAEPPHLDLLLAARRRWRRALPSCSLASLEYHVLQVERERDVPGHLMPELYWQYQQSGDGRLLCLALEHNASDILSLVTLAAHLRQLAEEDAG